MINSPVLSQRDWRWRWSKLGNGNAQSTIGRYGCTLTCLTSWLGLFDPRITNDTLLRYGGFGGATGNLILWSRLPICFPSIKSATRYFSYDNDKVKASLAKGVPVLVEVDGTVIGAVRHWVLYLGNQKMMDPWTGMVESTSKYPAVGFTLIERK